MFYRPQTGGHLTRTRTIVPYIFHGKTKTIYKQKIIFTHSYFTFCLNRMVKDRSFIFGNVFLFCLRNKIFSKEAFKKIKQKWINPNTPDLSQFIKWVHRTSSMGGNHLGLKDGNVGIFIQYMQNGLSNMKVIFVN